ncbi:hypothetical protein ACPA54_02930 [Uniformispora flossi]|uniref:hypothetical protein n=1 Tax=Uniformispora flossi TaxID=3390723 RepID=UPI003C2C6AFF
MNRLREVLRQGPYRCSNRRDAAAPVAALADPDRGFDAIVIGSSERAFYGKQFATMAPLFAPHGISV